MRLLTNNKVQQGVILLWNINDTLGQRGLSVLSPYGFMGKALDSSGLMYNYFRDYDPSLGRYVQSDPIGIMRDYSDPQMQAMVEFLGISLYGSGGGLNHLYGYVGGNPLFWIDPFGLEEMCQKIGYQACKQIAKKCQQALGMANMSTIAAYPCQVAQTECRIQADEQCAKEKAEEEAKEQEDDDWNGGYCPDGTRCTFEKFQQGLCG